MKVLKGAMKGNDTNPWRCKRCMQMRKHSAQFCPICQTPWQACIDTTYVHQPRSQQSDSQSYAPGWQANTQWDYSNWDQHQGYQSPRHRANSPRHRQRPRSAKKQHGRGQGPGKGGPQQVQSMGKGMDGTFPPPPLPPPQVPWTPQLAANHAMQMMTPMQYMAPTLPTAATLPATLTPMQSMPQQPNPVTTSHTANQLHFPVQSPPQLPAPDSKLLEFIKQRRSSLPSDVQQEIAKHEGARTTQDLFTAAEQMTRAKEDYEHALLGRSQHLHAWKGFLAKAVADWQEFAKQFLQHENDLQERITVTKELFLKAKMDLDQARQDAGEVVDLTEEDEKVEEGVTSGSSVAKVTKSIHHLATSLQQLQSEAAALETEIPNAKRPRVAPHDVKDEHMNAEAPGSMPPFGKAGQ